jgi:hypothetical protein
MPANERPQFSDFRFALFRNFIFPAAAIIGAVARAGMLQGADFVYPFGARWLVVWDGELPGSFGNKQSARLWIDRRLDTPGAFLSGKSHCDSDIA